MQCACYQSLRTKFKKKTIKKRLWPKIQPKMRTEYQMNFVKRNLYVDSDGITQHYVTIALGPL